MTTTPTPTTPLGRVSRSAVSPATATVAMIKRILPAVATRGRLIALAAVGLIGMIIAVAVSRGTTDPGLAAEFVAAYGLVIFLPIVSLVVASATLGLLREERTLVYFWLRPIGRWQIAVAALVSGLLVVLPLATVVMAALAAILGQGDDIAGAVVAGLVGVVAYTSLFTMLGLFTKRALTWGLAYILIWEGFIGGLSRFAGRLSVRSYTTSALQRITDVELLDNPESMAVIVLVTLGIAVVSLVAATAYLNRMEVD